MDKERLVDVLEVLGIAIVVIVVIFFVFGALTIPSELQHCALFDGTEITHRWVLFGGCFIQRPNGMWVDSEDYFMLEHLGEVLE